MADERVQMMINKPGIPQTGIPPEAQSGLPGYVPPEDRAQRRKDLDDLRTDLASYVRPDPVNHPAHYTGHPSGIECIQVTEHMDFLVGNAVKYLWRFGQKGDIGDQIMDLEKSRWYIERKIKLLQGSQ